MEIEELKAKYMIDAPSKKELENYYKFLLVAEGMDGKLIKTPRSYFKSYEDALRVAKSLQKPTTHHIFIEGAFSNNQMSSKPLYQWRNPKAK